MKIRYYTKSFKDIKGIENFERGGYIFIEHHKINKFEKVKSLINKSENVLFDFEFKKTNEASELYKESKITHEIKIITKQSEITETIYLKPNIIQKYRLYLNNRKTTNWLKEQRNKYSEKAIYGLIIMLIGLLGYYIKIKMNNAAKEETVSTSKKRDTIDFSKDLYLISNDTLTIEKTEISRNKKTGE